MKDGLPGTKIKTETVMKKIFALFILSVLMVSCYEDYIHDYTYTGIYFPYQVDVRTFVVGEGMKIDVGVGLGGVRENAIDRNVQFSFDNTLITPALLVKMKGATQSFIANSTAAVTSLLPLPSNYYTISNPNTMVIKAGQHMGAVQIAPDSVTFLNDSVNTIKATYMLPFRITAADADSIVFDKKTNTVAVMFENMLFGNYWHGGKAIINRPGLPDTVYTYKTEIPTAEPKIWILKTAGPSTLFCNGYLDQASTTVNEMKLVLKGSKVFVSSTTGSTNVITPDGESSFNRSKLLQQRKVFLKYKYTAANGFTYHCTDTLTFRNRIRDGINEWQDENPSHYTK